MCVCLASLPLSLPPCGTPYSEIRTPRTHFAVPPNAPLCTSHPLNSLKGYFPLCQGCLENTTCGGDKLYNLIYIWALVRGGYQYYYISTHTGDLWLIHLTFHHQSQLSPNSPSLPSHPPMLTPHHFHCLPHSLHCRPAPPNVATAASLRALSLSPSLLSTYLKGRYVLAHGNRTYCITDTTKHHCELILTPGNTNVRWY